MLVFEIYSKTRYDLILLFTEDTFDSCTGLVRVDFPSRWHLRMERQVQIQVPVVVRRARRVMRAAKCLRPRRRLTVFPSLWTRLPYALLIVCFETRPNERQMTRANESRTSGYLNNAYVQAGVSSEVFTLGFVRLRT